MGSGAKLCNTIVKYLRISSYIRKLFLIYDFAPDPIWISLYMREIVICYIVIQYVKPLQVAHTISRYESLFWVDPSREKINQVKLYDKKMQKRCTKMYYMYLIIIII
jgi:hypothetical protein